MSKRLVVNLLLLFLTVSAGLFVFETNQSFSKKSEQTSSVILKPITVHTTDKKIELTVPKKTEITTSTLTLLAVGDIMLDRSVLLKTQAAKDYNHPFVLIDSLFKEYDVHLGNLEGPITTSTSVSNGKGGARFMFTFSPNFVEPLKNRFQFLSLANNHESNFGQKGIDQTRKFLGDAGVHYFGDPNNVTEFISVASTYNGITLGFVGYHQLVETGFENVITEVQRLRPLVDVVIVMPHWGVEYATEKPSLKQVEEAHALVDAGADIIVGAHPHVVEPIEIYKDKIIFYSLGNFVFDQYFSPETMTGLAVGMKIEKSDHVNIYYTLLPIEINGESQPSVASEIKKEKLLKSIGKNSIGSDDFKQKIQIGKW